MTQAVKKRVEDPWRSIMEQQNAIFCLPRVSPSVLQILQKDSAKRATTSRDPVEEALSFNEGTLQSIEGEIFGTNDRLSRSHQKAVEKLIEDASYDLDAVNDEIVELSYEMNSIQLQVNQLLEQMDALRHEQQDLFKKQCIREKNLHRCISLRSPARLLPFDVLATIFRYCEPSREEGPKSSPLLLYTLCHTCSAWRQAALALPFLWNTEDFEFGRTEDDALSFTIQDNELMERAPCTMLVAFRIALVFRESLSSLCIFANNLDDLFQLPSITFPVLETLYILEGSLDHHIHIPKSQVFSGARKLRKLVLDIQVNDAFWERQALNDFPWAWSRITYLNIRQAVPLGFIPNVLSRLVHLRYASITLRDSFLDRRSPIESYMTAIPFACKKLRELHLQFTGSLSSGSTLLSSLFSLIKLPPLKKFTLRSNFWYADIDKIPIFSALESSVDSLQSLTLTPLYLDRGEVGRLLAHCGHLSNLTLILTPPSPHNGSARTSVLLNEVMPGIFDEELHSSHSTSSLSLANIIPRLISFNVTLVCTDFAHFHVLLVSLRHLYLSSIRAAVHLTLESLSLIVSTDRPRSSGMKEANVQPVLQELQDQVLQTLKTRDINANVKVDFAFRKDAWEKLISGGPTGDEV